MGLKNSLWLGFDMGIVLSFLGGSKSKKSYKGFFNMGNIGLGIYMGPSLNAFEKIGPSIGIGLLLGLNGFFAGKIGFHIKKRFGGAIILPIIPIYGMEATAVILPNEVKACMILPILVATGYYINKVKN